MRCLLLATVLLFAAGSARADDLADLLTASATPAPSPEPAADAATESRGAVAVDIPALPSPTSAALSPERLSVPSPLPVSGVLALETEAAPEVAEPAGAVAAAVTQADATAKPGMFREIWDTFDRGGWVMWVLLATSVVGGAFAVERFLALRRERASADGLMPRLREAMASGGVSRGRALLKENPSALAQVMDAVLSRSGATRRELEGAIDDESGRVYCTLRDNLRPVALVATVAPLLGLLGTVFGLITAFRMAAELGMDDPRNFAGGIYEALYTTAFGLVIAIPFMVIHNALRGTAEAIARAAESEALDFVMNASAQRKAVPQAKDGSGEKVA